MHETWKNHKKFRTHRAFVLGASVEFHQHSTGITAAVPQNKLLHGITSISQNISESCMESCQYLRISESCTESLQHLRISKPCMESVQSQISKCLVTEQSVNAWIWSGQKIWRKRGRNMMMSGLVCPHWDKSSLRQRYSCYFQISTVLFVYLWGRGSENRHFQNPGIAKIGFIPPPQFWHEFDQKKCTMWLATTTHIMNKWITRSRKFWNLPKKIKSSEIGEQKPKVCENVTN